MDMDRPFNDIEQGKRCTDSTLLHNNSASLMKTKGRAAHPAPSPPPPLCAAWPVRQKLFKNQSRSNELQFDG